MSMMYIRITVAAYFLTDTANWQVLWGKEKYLLNSSFEKLKAFFKTNVNSEKSLPYKDKKIKVKFIAVSF